MRAAFEAGEASKSEALREVKAAARAAKAAARCMEAEIRGGSYESKGCAVPKIRAEIRAGELLAGEKRETPGNPTGSNQHEERTIVDLSSETKGVKGAAREAGIPAVNVGQTPAREFRRVPISELHEAPANARR